MIPPIIPDGPRYAPPDDGVPDDVDILAAEYVIGSLSAEERQALLAGARAPELRQHIALWEERLLPLTDSVPAASPPPELWQRLVLATGLGVQVRPLPPAGRARQAQLPPRNPAAFWQVTTALSVMVAAGLAAFIFAPSTRTPEPLMAALSPAGAPSASYLVRVDPTGVATVFAVTAPPTAAAGKALQLWALPEGSTTPASLGLLNPSGSAQLRIRSSNGTRLLVSLEPLGGSTTGKPTGPIVYAGVLANGT